MIKRLAKKTICILLVLTLAIPLGGFVSHAAITTSEITNILDYYKKEVFPQDWHWDTGNPATSQPGKCNSPYSCTTTSFANSWQCHGFALYLASSILGSYPRGSLSSYYNGLKSGVWTCYTRSALGSAGLESLGLQPGDIIRASSDANYASGHTAFVWKIEDGKAYFAEAWGSQHSKINWGGFNYYSYSMSAICSRYEYVALWRNSQIINTGEYVNPARCDHNYLNYHTSTHPHEDYQKCSKCSQVIYLGTYYKDPTCACCNGTHSYSYNYETSHPHKQIKSCSVCGERSETGAYQVSKNCNQCKGVPSYLNLSVKEETVALGDLVHIDYSAFNASEVTINLYKDGVFFKSFWESPTTASLSYEVCARISEPGYYTLTMTAKNGSGSSLYQNTTAFFARAHVEGLYYDENYIYITYADHLTRSAATAFASKRGGELNHFDGLKFEIKVPVTPRAVTSVGQSRFDIIGGNFTYDEAALISSLLGGNLAKITSTEENDAIKSALAISNLYEVWIGGQDDDLDGKWTWSDGTDLTYTNWSLSHSAQSEPSQRWVAIYHSGQWCEAPLGAGDGFVVEYDGTYRYTFDGKGRAVLTAYTGPLNSNGATDITIPEQYNGVTVASLGSNIFANMNIGKLYLPATLHSIGEGALSSVGRVFCPRNSETAYTLSALEIPFKYNMDFADVPVGKWYHDSVLYCYENDIMNGTSDSDFSPNLTITRAQIVVILANMNGGDLSNYAASNTFVDVGANKYYHNAVEWAAACGITSGTGGGSFSPNGQLSRSELVVMLYNYAKLKGLDTSADIDLGSFADAETISSWAREAFRWGVAHQLISGVTQEDTMLIKPKDKGTRAQCSTIIKSFVTNLIEVD